MSWHRELRPAAKLPGRLLYWMIAASVLILVASPARAAQVVYLGPSKSETLQQLKRVADFYGFAVAHEPVPGVDARQAGELESSGTIGLVIDAEVLGKVNFEWTLAKLRRKDRDVPVLIAGVTQHTSADLLHRWSTGTILSCNRGVETTQKVKLELAPEPQITRQLGGMTLPATVSHLDILRTSGSTAVEPLLWLQDVDKKEPIFARVVGDQNIFLATALMPIEPAVTPDPFRQQELFGGLAPWFLFLSYAGGDRAWHSEEHYANFTLDDLWLRPQYGHVNYAQLLDEAERHNFHVTVAFIPWNFDRSDPKTVELFRQHADRLSICVHGNNHVHQEFGPVGSHPLDKQAHDLVQALARMNKFQELTGLSYDPVMVFPHSVGPRATFSLLKQDRYLATANSLNVPLDAQAPEDLAFALRTATLRFANFPSLRRYSTEAELPDAQLAIDAFLGNPILLYAHESYFADGEAAFNSVADTVNRIQPGTEWRSLGTIARHLYLERLGDDGTFEIAAYSDEIELKNTHGRDALYVIRRDEQEENGFKVQVDGAAYPYQLVSGTVSLQIKIPSGGVRRIAILPQAGPDLSKVAIAKDSFKVRLIRRLSDFRDNEVSRSAIGRGFIRSYGKNPQPWDLAALYGTIALGMGTLVLAWWLIQRKATARNGSRTGQDRPQADLAAK